MSDKVYGIDMGTNSIKISQKNAGVVLHQKNMIAMVRRTEPLALGDEAYAMYEKAPKNIDVKKPVVNGVIADFSAMQSMIQLYFKGFKGKKMPENLVAGSNSEFYIAVPTDITEVEKRAFFDVIASSSLKTKKIRLVEKPIADAIGAGLDVMNATGRLVVNIGADTTEISLISLGGIVQSRLLKVGGTKFDESIQQAVKKKHNLVIGMKSAERLKMNLASGIKEDEEITFDVMGRNLITGLPSKVTVTNHLVFDAMSESLSSIIDSIRFILEKTPPELSMDIMHEGVCMTGGSTHIKNLDLLIQQETGLAIMKMEDPELTVARGLCMIMENPEYDRMAYNFQESSFH